MSRCYSLVAWSVVGLGAISFGCSEGQTDDLFAGGTSRGGAAGAAADAGRGGSGAGEASGGGVSGGGSGTGLAGGSGKGGGGAGSANDGGAAGASGEGGEAGEGGAAGASAGASGASAGTGGKGGGAGGSAASGSGGTGGSQGGGAGGTGGTGAAGGATAVPSVLGTRTDTDASDFWVMKNDLVWLGKPATGQNRVPFRAAIAGGNGAVLSPMVMSNVTSLVPEPDGSAVFFDGEAGAQFGVARFAFGSASVQAVAISSRTIALVAASSSYVCWVEGTTSVTTVCRTRSSSPLKIESVEKWAPIGTIAATPKYFYFTLPNTDLMRWDPTTAKAAKVTSGIGRVKSVGKVAWGVGGDGFLVRLEDDSPPQVFGPGAFPVANVSQIVIGPTPSRLYVGLTTADGKSARIIRFNQADKSVETVLESACASPLAGVGANDKKAYYLCGDDTINAVALP